VITKQGGFMLGRNIAAFPSVRNRTKDWTPQELAEFYRVESALIQGGMRVVTDRGLTDEGDPWFVFCREDDSEPVAHFARINGQYLIASPAYDGIARGHDFRSMVQNLLSRHRLTARGEGDSSNVLMHPAALLIIVVGTAFFKTPGQAKADESHKDGPHKTDAGGGGASMPGLAWTIGALEALKNDNLSQSGQNWNEEQLAIASAVVFAASSYEAASAPVVVTPAATQSLFETSDSGFGSGHASFVQSVLSELETSVASADFTPIKAAGSSTGWLYADVASTLDLMAKLNHIPLADQTGAFEITEHSASLSAPWSNNSSDYALLAAKAYVGGPSTGVSAPLAAFIDALQSGDHAGMPPPQLSANVVYHENATAVDSLPASLTSLPSYVSVQTQTGSAGAFLVENNIFITLQFNAAAQSAADAHSTLNNSTSAGNVQVASIVDHTTTTQPSAASPQTAATAGAQNIVISTGVGANSNEVLTASEFIQTLDLFLGETPNASVVVSQQKYVFISPQGTSSSSSVLESVTMTFNDGSSISIVGQQQTLHDLVSHVQ
jgi:hypothetical protein